MKKFLLLLLMVLCVRLSGQSRFSPYAGIGVNYGFSTWDTPLPALCVGGRISDLLSIEFQLGSIGFGNQLKVNQKFHLLNMVEASHEFSCLFIGATPFYTYAVKVGAGIPIFKKASLSVGVSYVVWDQLQIADSDPLHAFLLDRYPTERWNIAVFYTAPFFPGYAD